MEVAQRRSDTARALPEDIRVWRGISSTRASFGAEPANLAAFIGHEWVEQRFMSTTTDRGTASPEFTHSGNTPAILLITARAGAPAVWIPPLGRQETAGQNELLLTQGIRVRILAVDMSGDLPEIAMEVI